MREDTPDLFDANQEELAAGFLASVLKAKRRPSGAELVFEASRFVGPDAAWHLPSVVAGLARSRDLNEQDRDYCHSLLARNELVDALRRPAPVDLEAVSSIDSLIQSSQRYRNSVAFREMVDFIGRFRDYSPYNNMLVRVQRPSCSFFATRRDWERRFGKKPKDDARPMIILAPMHPVLLVYDLEDIDKPNVPKELREFSLVFGPIDPRWLDRVQANARGYRIKVEFKKLSSTQSGYATHALGQKTWKMTVVVHQGLDTASQLGVLAHELAHVFLGHLGTDYDQWWPARANIHRAAMEVEAEAVTYIVTERLGLKGSSVPYVSRHLTGGELPVGVSIDLIAKTATLIERFARAKVPAPKPKAQPKAPKSAQK
jgi:hypothetical protein